MAMALPRAAHVRRERLAGPAPEPPEALPRETEEPWFFGQYGCSYCETRWTEVANGFRTFAITVTLEARRRDP